jgi:hypothetical protein
MCCGRLLDRSPWRRLRLASWAAKGIKDAIGRQRRGIEAGIRSCLEADAGKTVQRAGRPPEAVASK